VGQQICLGLPHGFRDVHCLSHGLFGITSGHSAAALYVMKHETISATKTAEGKRDMASVTLFGQFGLAENGKCHSAIFV
jgi:hypothetical protein